MIEPKSVTGILGSQSTCRDCGESIIWVQVHEGRWVPCYGCECGALHEHRPYCAGVPQSVEALDNARRYAWAQVYEERRKVDRLETEIALRDEAAAIVCIECDERPPVVDGLCDRCLKAHCGGVA